MHSETVRHPSALFCAVILSIAVTLTACDQTARLQSGGTMSASGSKNAQTTASVFPDIPIPNGASMNVDKTLVVGTDNWFGQLALESNQGAAELFDFYRSRLPQYGWQEITSVRAPVSVLTYDRDDRILQMQIKGSTLRGSEITLTVSPRGAPAPVGGPAPVTRIN